MVSNNDDESIFIKVGNLMSYIMIDTWYFMSERWQCVAQQLWETHSYTANIVCV